MKAAWNSGGKLHILREAASSLARLEVGERLKSLASARTRLPEYEFSSRKSQILHRIKRLCPDNMGSLNLLARRVGEVPTNDGKEMGELLKEHWSATFSKKEVDFKDLDSWWKEDSYSFDPDGLQSSPQEPPPPPSHDHSWALTVEH
eukprot:10417061-Heterocapsa_arctica.AAC.1